MLDVARHRPGGECVRWIEGDAGRLDEAQADLAIMTGHVAQVVLDDESWHGTLAATHRALRAGGCAAFESRNPRVRPWAAWTPQATRRHIDHASRGGSKCGTDCSRCGASVCFTKSTIFSCLRGKNWYPLTSCAFAPRRN